MKKIFIPGFIALLLLLSAVYLAESGILKGKKARRADTAALCRQLDELAAAYDADCRELLRTFPAELEKNTAPDFAGAGRAVPAVVSGLCSFKAGMKLCCKAAKDQIKGTHDFRDAYLAAVDAPIIRPCIHANAVAADMLRTLQLRLHERFTQYAAALAAAGGNAGAAGELPAKDLEKLQNCLGAFAGSVQKANLEKALAGAGVALELIFIRETCRYTMKLLAKPVAKICGSLTAAGICAAADGPLPFGDLAGAVLSLGGLTWTAWDIYEATLVMPGKLHAELRQGIAAAQAELLTESCRQAEELVQVWRQAGGKINRELKAQLQ